MIAQKEYIFETSWEVCNKVGGIHTVITSKYPELHKLHGNNIAFIGPDVNPEHNSEFVEDKNLFVDWKEAAAKEGLLVRLGHWDIPNKPFAILIDFKPLIDKKNQIFTHLWDTYGLDSLSGDWGYTEAALFGYAVGKTIASFSKMQLQEHKVVAQFHEWMTGAGVLYLKQNAPQIATVFTTHATVIGRSIAGNSLPLYSQLASYNGDQMASNLGVKAKHSLEKNAAHHAHVFTTVSEVTAKECTHLLDKTPDYITPNGFALEHLAPITSSDKELARKKLIEVYQALSNQPCSDHNTLFVCTSGRYEYKNKGIDVFLESLHELNQQAGLSKQIVAFVMVPGDHRGPRPDLQSKLNHKHHENLETNICTHQLNPEGYDAVVDQSKRLHLQNYPGQKAHLIFVPVYLNGNDGIFNIPYYQLLSAFDLSVFPSYYEPWGYTPLESLALGVPSITTTLAGFGQWMQKYANNVLDGLRVCERTEDNYSQLALDISRQIELLSKSNKADKAIVSKKAKKLAQETTWSKFIIHYTQAYNKAIDLSSSTQKQTHTSLLEENKKDINMASNEPVWKKMIIQSNLPDQLSHLKELSMNLWWFWNYQATELFESINPELWVKSKKNPIRLLNSVSANTWDKLKNDAEFVDRLNSVYNEFKAYMEEPKSPEMPNIAYFSMEYGLSDNIKIYSGGLGILAGDYLKEASDCNTPMVAVGFLYKFGYFMQRLTVSGEQQADMVAQKFAELPITPVYDKYKQLLLIDLNLPGRTVKARVWLLNVGRVPLYLLDTDYKENHAEDRAITHQLYGGDWENRLKQEMLLGLGGIRLLEALEINSEIYHCNEGHAALINAERLAHLIQNDNLNFNQALEVVRSSSLFTTHTPVPAGHDEFEENLIKTYLSDMPERLKVDWNTFLNLGRGHQNNEGDKFSMSVLAARTSQEMNGVSRLHGDVSKDMFQYMWNGFAANELHIDYVTNGVHYPTWTATEWRKFYEKEFGKDFLKDQSNPKHWEKIYDAKDAKVWEIRNQLRKKLISYVKERYHESFIKRHESPKTIMDTLEAIDDKTLTIGFARRFATYKRAHLIFSDIDRLARIVNNPEKPVQFLFAGKAHPHDKAGQDLIKHIIEVSRRPEFIGKILFVENYDMELGKRLVSGVDVWLNNPTRPLEASGTSGQKAELNGVLNFSVLDGWWVEGYKEKAGWALPEKRTYTNQDFQNELDAAMIYSILENEIVPIFYDRDKNDLPKEWIQYVKRSIAGIAPHFTTKRMLDDYIDKFYLKLHKRAGEVNANTFEKAIEIAQWKEHVLNHWNKVEVVSIDFPNTQKNDYQAGQMYRGEVVLDLKELSEKDLGIELVFSLDGGNKVIDSIELKLAKKIDSLAFYEIEFELKRPGNYDYGIRLYPKNNELPHRQDFAHLRWI